MEIVTEIKSVLLRFRNIPYLGEGVTQYEHALQAAREAEKARASDVLITAALLHDIGHLVNTLPPEDASYVGFWTQNDGHEVVGAKWLARGFPESVFEPVRWHVRAKRYLCAAEPGYFSQMTAGAQHSLELQGGPLSPEECRGFENHPWFREAIAVRRWDDNAKVVNRTTPPLEHYLEFVRRCVRAPTA
jgi:[1-hydroxy-2-(trimethylamino)ethyl]phosphonate dioxygenase